MCKKITLATLCLLFCTKMFASHITGGEIGYSFDGTSYTINLTLYSQCNSISSVAASQSVTCQSIACSSSINLSLTNTSIDTIKEMYCPSAGAACNASTTYYLAYHFSGTTTLSQCSDWKISFSSCCLNGQIINIYNPSSESIYLETMLNNSAAPNNSAIIKNYPIMLMATGSVNTNSIQTMDADGDSVSYQFIVPQDGASTTISYSPAYNLSNPIGGSANIDAANQYMQLEASSGGFYYLSMRTSEYRNGSLIGYTTRIWTTTVFPAGTSPKVPLPAPGSNFTCLTHPGQTQTINVSFDDSTATDSVFVSFDPSNSWTYTTTAAPAAGTGAGSITWTTPTSLNPAATPFFYIYVLAQNNSCPQKGFAWYTILVNTAQASINDSVWAGDANGDNMANMYDPLAIAVAYGQTGPTRSGATTSWVPEYCANWSTYYLPAVINVKHADCNGDGTVNSTDLAAVTANYGLTHPKGHPTAQKTTGVPDLYFDLTGITLTPGANISVPIKFGTASLPMNNIYGLAAGVELIGAVNLSAAPTITYSSSWIGTASNTLNFTKDINNNRVDWAYARIDQTNVSGNGTIATLNFTVPTTATTGQQMKFHFEAPQVIDKYGNPIVAYNVLDDSLNVALGIANIPSAVQYAEVVPNPSKSQAELQMFVAQAGNINIKITDLLGRTAWQQTMNAGTGNQNIALPNTNIIPGMYMIQIQGEGWRYSKTLKWVKE